MSSDAWAALAAALLSLPAAAWAQPPADEPADETPEAEAEEAPEEEAPPDEPEPGGDEAPDAGAAFGAAKTLFLEALALYQEKSWEAACPKFEAAVKLYPSASGISYVAECHEHFGRVASAWNEYQRAKSAAIAQRATRGEEATKRVVDLANERIAALAPRLPKLTIALEAPAVAPTNLVVLRDGQPIPATIGVALPVDPGDATITLRAPGYVDASADVTLVEGATKELHLALRRVPVPPPAVPPPPPPDAPTPEPEGIPVYAWISGGVGLALVGVSIAFVVDGVSAADDLEKACPPVPAEDPLADQLDRRCESSTRSDIEDLDARRTRDIGLAVGFGLGGALALGAATYGIVTGLGSTENVEAAWVTPIFGAHTVGLLFRGEL